MPKFVATLPNRRPSRPRMNGSTLRVAASFAAIGLWMLIADVGRAQENADVPRRIRESVTLETNSAVAK